MHAYCMPRILYCMLQAHTIEALQQALLNKLILRQNENKCNKEKRN